VKDCHFFKNNSNRYVIWIAGKGYMWGLVKGVNCGPFA